MRVALDVSFGPGAVHLLTYDQKHRLVLQALPAEPDMRWVPEALARGAELIVSGDKGIVPLAMHHAAFVLILRPPCGLRRAALACWLREAVDTLDPLCRAERRWRVARSNRWEEAERLEWSATRQQRLARPRPPVAPPSSPLRARLIEAGIILTPTESAGI